MKTWKASIHKIALLAFAVSLFFSLPMARANEMSKELGELDYVVGRGELQALLAKEICSCRWVSGLSIQECKDRMPLPSAVFLLLSVNEVPESHMVYVTPNVISNIQAQASYDPKRPREGCHLGFGRLNYP